MGKILDIIAFGDCRDIMRQWAADSVRAQTCVTSPPYFGLRDYGHPGQIGLEQTPEQYVAAMVEVFRCVRDVLVDDGTLWLNLGDSYNGASVNRIGQNGFNDGRTNRDQRFSVGGVSGLKPKDLVGIPWRVAFALQADGWWLRQDIIWHKPNPMPESVRDRCTKAHEYIFLLSKSERYYYDAEAVKEAAVSDDNRPSALKRSRSFGYNTKDKEIKGYADKPGEVSRKDIAPINRNRRSVWTIATKPYKGAHFATFPPALIEPCILAGSRTGDIVLDPFMGSGTTAAVALQKGRHYLGCELNPLYGDLQRERIDSVSASRHQLGSNLEAV